MICNDCKEVQNVSDSRRRAYALAVLVNSFLPWRYELREVIIPFSVKKASMSEHNIVKTRSKPCFVPRFLCHPEVPMRCTTLGGGKRLKLAKTSEVKRDCPHSGYAYRACIGHDVCSSLMDMYPGDDSVCLDLIRMYLRTDEIHDDPYFWEIFSITLAEELNNAIR